MLTSLPVEADGMTRIRILAGATSMEFWHPTADEELMTRTAWEGGFVAGLVLFFAIHLPCAALAQDGTDWVTDSRVIPSTSAPGQTTEKSR
jgi:hypothetical protein